MGMGTLVDYWDVINADDIKKLVHDEYVALENTISGYKIDFDQVMYVFGNYDDSETEDEFVSNFDDIEGLEDHDDLINAYLDIEKAFMTVIDTFGEETKLDLALGRQAYEGDYYDDFQHGEWFWYINNKLILNPDAEKLIDQGIEITQMRTSVFG